MIGRAAGMRRAFEMADRVAPTDSTVLILGESGTGKICRTGNSAALPRRQSVCSGELRASETLIE